MGPLKLEPTQWLAQNLVALVGLSGPGQGQDLAAASASIPAPRPEPPSALAPPPCIHPAPDHLYTAWWHTHSQGIPLWPASSSLIANAKLPMPIMTISQWLSPRQHVQDQHCQIAGSPSTCIEVLLKGRSTWSFQHSWAALCMCLWGGQQCHPTTAAWLLPLSLTDITPRF